MDLLATYLAAMNINPKGGASREHLGPAGQGRGGPPGQRES